MIKFIKAEGKTDQEVQDYINKCVSEGAEANEAVEGTDHNGFYFEDHYLSRFDYAGVNLRGETWLSNDLDDFVDVYDGKCIDNIESLLAIKEAASEVFNNLEYDVRNEKLNEAVEALGELLS